MGKQTGYSSVSKDIQDIANLGLDRDYNVPMSIGYVYNPTTDKVDRMVQPGNEIPTEGNNPVVEYDYTDPTSIVLTKTIGSDTYQQTISIVGTVATEGAWVKL